MRNLPLQLKIFGLIAAVVCAVAACSFVLIQSTLSTSLSSQVESRAKALGAYVASRAADPLLTNNIHALNALVDDTMSNNDDVEYLFIKNENGEVIVDSNPEADISPELAAANAAIDEEGAFLASARELETQAGRIMDTASPIFKDGGAEVRLGMGYSSVGSFIGSVNAQFLAMVGSVLIVALAVAYATVSITLKPVKKLVSLTEGVSRGDFATRAQDYNHDEIGRLAESFNAMLDELQAAEADRRDYLERIERKNTELEEKKHIQSMLLGKVIRAQEDERRRIARELHDETSHSLTAMLIELRSVREEGDLSEEQAAHLHDLKNLIDGALKDINQLAWNLRPSVLDKFGLQVSLERYAEETESHSDLSIDLIMKGDAACLTPDSEITIYRLVQEAVTNIMKYAQATEVDVVVVVNDAFVSVAVEDNGTGFDVAAVMRARPGEHLGLLGMDERVSLLGGTLTIESTVGQGTTVLAKIPLEKEGAGDAA